MVMVLSRAGDQVPVIPSIEVVRSGDKVVPAQIGSTVTNVGVTTGLTVIVNVVGSAHRPASGVKV